MGWVYLSLLRPAWRIITEMSLDHRGDDKTAKAGKAFSLVKVELIHDLFDGLYRSRADRTIDSLANEAWAVGVVRLLISRFVQGREMRLRQDRETSVYG
jgi:hypothetical protein